MAGCTRPTAKERPSQANVICYSVGCSVGTPGQHRDYQAWIDNDRRIRELLDRLEALGTAAFEAYPRYGTSRPRPARRTGGCVRQDSNPRPAA